MSYFVLTDMMISMSQAHMKKKKKKKKKKKSKWTTSKKIQIDILIETLPKDGHFLNGCLQF